jgi:hypothetical protein
MPNRLFSGATLLKNDGGIQLVLEDSRQDKLLVHDRQARPFHLDKEERNNGKNALISFTHLSASATHIAASATYLFTLLKKNLQTFHFLVTDSDPEQLFGVPWI